jgi:hypothetical protein
VGHVHDPRERLDPAQVAEGERLDDRDLVDHHQPIEPGEVDPHLERLVHRREIAEHHEREDDRQDREDRPELPAQQAPPDQGEVLHAAGSEASLPLSR